jgi:hypothetical protein
VSQSEQGDPDQLRDVRALARFEAFLFAAVATVLVVRSLLAVAGYPQVGGAGLHVAHVLWGGLLMAIAIVLVEIFPGTQVRLRAALLGGIGFGLFIDEVGKFLTKDVNYFFKPAIAIIYAVFVVFYLAVREVLQRHRLNDRRRLALACIALSDLALGQLDRAHRDYALRLLAGVDETSGLREAAIAVHTALLAERPTGRTVETRLTQLRDRVSAPLRDILAGPTGRRVLFGAGALIGVDIIITVVMAVTHPGKTTALPTVIDTGLPSLVSVSLLVVGIVQLSNGDSRSAVVWLQRAVLVQMLFSQVVVFNRTQWLGLIGFALDVILLWMLTSVAPVRDAQRAGPPS